MENSIFAKFNHQLSTAFVNVRSGNELLFIDVDLSKALFWNYQENMRDLVNECERFDGAVVKEQLLAPRQWELACLVDEARADSFCDVRELTGEELEPHLIKALTHLESIKQQFTDLMKVIGIEYGYQRFSATLSRI
ncbi:MAG: hypothetical protein ACK5NL_09435 [Vibrio fluvialis]